MNNLMQHLPILQVIVPLSIAVLCTMTKRGNLAWAMAVLSAGLSLAITVGLAQVLWAGPANVNYLFGGWSVPLTIEYRLDALNLFVLFIVNIIALATLFFAKSSVPSEIEERHVSWFYAMFLLCQAGLLGMALTNDAFNMFVFMEISSLASYVLVAMGRDRRALLAAYQYLIVGTIGATFFVIGIGFLYLTTGTLNLTDMAQKLVSESETDERQLFVGIGFITVGLCLKLALFPLHLWLPKAYSYAPSAVSAFLAGTATKVAIYLVIRLYYSIFAPEFGSQLWPAIEAFLVLSLAAMVLASLSAIYQSNAKKLLAFSSVAQIGYITLGLCLVNFDGLTGGIVHLMNHALVKTAAFIAMGAIYFRIGSVELKDMAGIGRTMPVTMAAFVVAGLGLIGVPATAGFISKWYLISGALERGLWPVVVIILISSGLAVVYVGKVVETAYFHAPTGAAAKTSDAPFWIMAPLIFLAGSSVFLGLNTDFNLGLAQTAAHQLLQGLGQ